MTVRKSEWDTSSMVDESLIFAIAQGDTEALHRLYEATASSVYGFALSLTKNAPDAEDVLQDTFLTVHQKAALYRPQGKPLAWLLTIARNHVRMKQRRQGKEMATQEPMPDNSLAYSRIERPEDRWAMETLLQILNTEERQIVVLHAVSGLKNREIAALLRRPLGTVLAQYHRAVKKLKMQWEKENTAYEAL